MVKRLASLSFLIAVTGCQPSDAPSDPEIQALRARLAGAASPGPGAEAAGDSRHSEQLRDLYQRRQYQPVWIIDGKARDFVATLRTLLAAAGDDGLDPGRYQSDRLRAQIQALKEGTQPAHPRPRWHRAGGSRRQSAGGAARPPGAAPRRICAPQGDAPALSSQNHGHEPVRVGAGADTGLRALANRERLSSRRQ